jgi:hypothetical protein
VPAPTLIASIQIDSPWAQTINIAAGVATKNLAGTLSTQAGDLIVALQASADSANAGTLTTSDGTNSYTQRTNLQNASHCSVAIATASDSAGGTRTITQTRSFSATQNYVGGIAFQFRAHGGVGNVLAAADGVQTGNLTCSDNSAILVIALDWNATTGSRSWASINGSAPTQTAGVDGDGATWSVAVAYFADVGSAGSKTITLSSPTFGAPTFAAIEILAGADTAKRLSLLGVG